VETINGSGVDSPLSLPEWGGGEEREGLTIVR